MELVLQHVSFHCTLTYIVEMQFWINGCIYRPTLQFVFSYSSVQSFFYYFSNLFLFFLSEVLKAATIKTIIFGTAWRHIPENSTFILSFLQDRTVNKMFSTAS
jgi:hypothetical protein